MKHLLFVEQSYSFAILRPIADAARARGDSVAWYVPGKQTSPLLTGETVLQTLAQARQFDGDSVIVPGNWVPTALKGLKVQVFHGFGVEKSGHFRIRGFFDLYCTPGPIPTAWFEQQAQALEYFRVIETGWPKLDPFAAGASADHSPGRPPRVLYAPTFSPSLESATELLPVWTEILKTGPYQISAKFHPLMDPELIAAYRNLTPLGLTIDQGDNAMQAIAGSDIVVSDTSSIVHEALWHHRPVITLRNAAPGKHLLDLQAGKDLPKAMAAVANDYKTYVNNGVAYAGDIHPYWDGRSSDRVLDAIQTSLTAPPPRKDKPRNYWRKLSVRRKIRRLERG